MKLVIGPVRLSYAHIFETHADLNDKQKYSASFIIPKKQTKTIAKIENAFKAMLADKDIVNKLGGKTKGIVLPLRDGDTDRSEDPAYQDSCFINASANPDRPPVVYSQDREEVVDKSEVYSGCWVQAVLNLYPYDKGVKRGIGVGLGGIRKLRDDTPLGGVAVSSDDFSDEDLDDDDLI